MVNIKLLTLILDEGKSKKINNLLNKFSIKVKTISNASGTASPSLLDYFGLVETRKNVFLAIIPDYLEEKIFKKLRSEFKLHQKGTGVGFTIPIASSNKYLSDSFSKTTSERVEKEMDITTETKYHLVITIVMDGYLNNVMNAAKRAGATGGTVIKGRGLGNINPAKILGFNIEPEREIVLTIVEEKIKTKVMEEITKEVGIKTPGKGICISLPIDQAIGFRSEVSEEND